MHSTFCRLLLSAGLVALVLGLVPTPQKQSEAGEPQPAPSAPSAFEHSAIGAVLRANCDEIPASGEDLIRVLHHMGEVAQLPVPFSAVSMSSGLANPRVILAPRSKEETQDKPPEGKEKIGKQGEGNQRIASPPTPPPVSQWSSAATPNLAGLDEPNLEGRLYFAANMEKEGKRLRAKTIEFISWNARRKRFDFGVIDYTNHVPEIKLLDGVRCFSCHKNKGPILGSGPWSNTTHNDVVREAAATTLSTLGMCASPRQVLGWDSRRVLAPGEKDPLIAIKSQTTLDGFSLVLGEPESVDAAVRLGNDLVRDRAIYKAMLKTPDGRKAFGFLLAAIVDPQPIDKSYQQVKQSLDLAFANNSTAFGTDVATIVSTVSSTLVDYSPSGSVGNVRTSTGKSASFGRGSALPANLTISWSSDTDKVIAYNSRRAAGDPAMASAKQPSNPKSFIHREATIPPRPSAAVSAASLARVIGLTEGDRAFFAQALGNSADYHCKQGVNATALTLAQEVFTGPYFMNNWKTGDIPDREEFKERFVEGLKAIARSRKLEKEVKFDRRDYASGPSYLAEPGREDREPELIPTTACQRCHDIRGIGKPSFNPIPMLAFDPFDNKSRDYWLRNADAGKKQAVLERMLKRLVTDMDMPPEDSLEHVLFRKKDKASFDGVREFLETELKKLQRN